MAWLADLGGAFLILLGLTEVFRTLLHPIGRGRVSRLLIRGLWHVGRRGARSSTLVGVAGVVATIITWVVLEVVGWALLILPLVPAGLHYAHGLRPSAYLPFTDALYFSLVTFSTVGYGDIVVTDPVLRLIAPLEALTGFALVTASLSWFTQLYPALARRRALAVRLGALHAVGSSDRFLKEPGATGLLTALAGEVAQATVDLRQNSETYYFRGSDADSTLPVMLIRLRQLVATVKGGEDGFVRWQGEVLAASLGQLVHTIGREIGAGGDEDVDDIIQSVLRDYALPSRRPS